ncbi:Pyridoxal-dependent decarboxylase, pyridoxal binding domain/Pyridoxal-dependent decarboxylase, C-terminal sheet domain containing protein, putative [Angomonas deanei]|uniref:ornithine decarboxylase n=1 Tax=Angomonas deanei TaxID=59799 RepID=A0A7G2C464_9TRYP|nr:Pyridoxal-dependent decarboxylase, pyridoxal binding domain/Pyridoxal-dependent decarboxylase, C-terminal sheet domain containing protein, putative [Angomonas deanei]
MALLYIYQGPQEETTPLPDESFTRSVVDSFASEDAAYHGNKPPLFSDNEEEEDTPEERNFSANNKSTNVKRTRHHKTDYIPIEKHDPFYLIDVGNLVRRMSLWRQYFPHVRPFFAVKCNPNPIFIHLLFALGAGFDCASKEEVNLVLNTINHNEAWSQAVRDDTDYKAFKRLRLSPEEDIVFANPCKQVGDILFAKEKRVNFFTFDNEEELRKIAKCYPDAKLIIRIKTNDQNAVCAFSTKFGSTVHSNQAHNRNTAKTLLLLAKELGLEIYGVSFHVGSGNGDVQAYVSALHDAHAVFAMAAEIGFNLTVLDIGGGYPGLSEGGDRVLAAIAAAMNPVLEELFIKEGVHVLSEPGRFFTASTHALAVNVFASRTIPLAERENKAVVEKLRASDVPESVLRRLGVMGEYKNGKKADESTPAVPVLEEHQFYLNDGLYNSFNCILFDHAAPRLFVLPSDERWSLPAEPPVENDPTREEEEGETAPVTQRPAPLQLTTLFGPTCDSMDCILKQSLFPPLHIGDWLLAPDMGSYTVAAGCAFNGFATRRREYICSLDLDL